MVGNGTAEDGAPLAAGRERFGIALMTFLVSLTALAFHGVLSGGLRRHPDIDIQAASSRRATSPGSR